MLDEQRQVFVAARGDGDQHGVGVVALVGAHALVLGDRLGLASLHGPGAGESRAPAQARKSRRDRQDRGGSSAFEIGA
jgi:hypothetical protein